MLPETRDAINAAVASARSLMKTNETLFADGKADTDEYRSNSTQIDGYLDEAESLRDQSTRENRAEQMDRWAHEAKPGQATPRGSEYAARALANGDRTATPEYRAAFDHYIRTYGAWAKEIPINGEIPDPFSEFRTLSIVSDPAGGYTVPADVRADLMARLPALSEILQLCTVIPTSRDLVQWPRVQPKNNDGAGGSDGLGSIYTSAFVGTMTGEVPATGAGNNEPSFGMFEIPIKRARSESRPSMDLASDTEFDLLTFLTKDGALNMALLRESQVVNGSGNGPNVAGIMSGKYDGGTSAPTQNQIKQVDVSGTTTHTISNTTADLGSANKILDLIYAVPRQYRSLPSMAVVGTSQTFKAVRKLIDGVGRYIWMPGFAGQPNDLEGYKVVISEFAPQDAANGGATDNDVLLAGALEMLMVAVRTTTTPQILLERYADTDQIGLVLRQRFGGGVSNTDAMRLGYVHS